MPRLGLLLLTLVLALGAPLCAQEEKPRLEDNPYLAVVAAWESLPNAVREAASGMETGSGEELRHMPEQLAAIWAQLDAVPEGGALAWSSEDDPLGSAGMKVRSILRARLDAASDAAERVAAIQSAQQVARAMHSHELLIGRLVNVAIEGMSLSAIAEHADEIDAASATRLLAGLPKGLDESGMTASFRAEREVFVEAPLRRLQAWRAARLREAAGQDWTLGFEVTALGHGAGDDIFIGFRERSTGHSFLVWRSAPAEGFEIRSVDVAHDRAVIAREGVEAEVRLSDQRLLHRALPIKGEEVKQFFGGIDPGEELATDRALESFIEKCRNEMTWMEAFFARQPAGPLSTDAVNEIEEWATGAEVLRAEFSSYIGVRAVLYRIRVQRDVLRALLEMRVAGESWASDAAHARLTALGVEVTLAPGRLRVTLPALPEAERTHTQEFVLGEGD